jgi:hypothetical protein
MIQNWPEYATRQVGTWQLESLLGEREGRAFFLSTNPSDDRKALVQIISADAPGGEAIRTSWRRARALSNPHLLRVYDTGEMDLDGASVVYAAMELPDDDVGEILAQRTLSADEARSMTAASADAIEYLSERGLRHGAITPANLFIVGQSVKLSVDTLAPGDEAGRREDIRQLGRTLVQSMTREQDPAAARQLSAPFQEIAEGCLAPDDQQWSPERILVALGKRTMRKAERATAAPAGAPPRMTIQPWTAAAAVAGLGLFGYWILHKPSESVPRPPKPVVTTAAPAATAPPAAAPPVVEKPSPMRPVRKEPDPALAKARKRTEPAAQADRARPATAPDGSWAVIAATYNSYSGAEKRMHKIGRLSPEMRPHIFPSDGEGTVYYVVLASGLSQTEAERLRDLALRHGAPRDTYVTKLKES